MDHRVLGHIHFRASVPNGTYPPPARRSGRPTGCPRGIFTRERDLHCGISPTITVDRPTLHASPTPAILHHIQVNPKEATLPTTTQLRELAHHLITAASNTDAEAPGVIHVVKGMDTVLTRLAGRTGSRSLIARAVSLAHTDVPSLKGIGTSADGVIEALEKVLSAAGPEDRIRDEVVVVAHLLGLLHTFIGERLTLQLIKEVWPDLESQHEDIRKDPRS